MNKGVLSAVVLVVASDVLLGGIPYHTASAAPGPSDADYDAAIEAARAGNPDAALPVIEERYRAEPANSSVIYDYILVLGWAKRLMEALSVYEALPPAEHPIYLDAAVARDYRDTGAYDKALALYRQGRARSPQELIFAYGEILTLTDSGHAEEAAAEANELLAAHPEDIELLSAAIYASAATDHYADTVALADRMLAIAPGSRDALRARVFALRALGQFMPALEAAEQSADAFSDAELRGLIGAQLAALVRAGENPDAGAAERLAATDRAIAELDRRIAMWAAEGAGDSQEARTARFDRIVALEDRARTAEVIAEYNALSSQGIELPTYALKAVADAYARQREPENARSVFERVLAAEPKDFDARIGLFYSELESEDFDAAFATIDALAAEQSPPTPSPGNPVSQTPNPQWLRANLIAALARFYAGDTAEAQRRVTDLVILSPNDASLRQALGTILLGRGKPHAADRQFANGQTIVPNDTDLAAARANVAITRGDRAEGAAESAALTAREPASNAAVQLARRVEILRRPELSVRWNANLQSTNIPVAGNSFAIDTQLYSAPIDDTYRVYTGYGYAVAKLPEGTIVNNHVALGLEYTGLDIAANAEISNDSSPRSHAGGRATIAWSPLDEWRFSANMQIFSADTPLRALKHDITANSWMVRAAYSPSDFRSYSLAGELVSFSDGNDRTVLDASALQRLLTQPHLTIDLTGEIYASKNSRPNAPYFNPREDLSGSVTLSANHILYRRYSFVYSHRLSVTGGEYFESGFAGGFAGSLYYEQRLRVNDSWEGALGVQLRRQPYDGHAENSFAVLGSVDWRF